MFIFYNWGGTGKDTIAFQKKSLCRTESWQELDRIT